MKQCLIMFTAILAIPKNWSICSSKLRMSLAREPSRGSPGTASYAGCARTSRTHALLIRSNQSLKQSTFKPSTNVYINDGIRMSRLWRRLSWLNFMKVELEVNLGYSVCLQVKRPRILFKNHLLVIYRHPSLSRVAPVSILDLSAFCRTAGLVMVSCSHKCWLTNSIQIVWIWNTRLEPCVRNCATSPGKHWLAYNAWWIARDKTQRKYSGLLTTSESSYPSDVTWPQLTPWTFKWRNFRASPHGTDPPGRRPRAVMPSADPCCGKLNHPERALRRTEES